MVPFPHPGGVLVRFAECGIRVDSAKSFIESETVFHRSDVLDEDIAAMVAHNSCAENRISVSYTHLDVYKRQVSIPSVRGKVHSMRSTVSP